MLIAFYILVVLLFLYTFVLANSNAPGLNGRISRLLYASAPQYIKRALSDLLGPTAFAKVVTIYNYTVYKRNPIMQILWVSFRLKLHYNLLMDLFATMHLPSRSFFFINRYLATLNGSFFCWLAFGTPLLPNSMISYYHKYVAYIGVMACHYSFYIACSEGPGVLTAENLECFDHQKYDGILYVEKHICRTCQIRKVMSVI